MSAEQKEKRTRRPRWLAWLAFAAVAVCVAIPIAVHFFDRDYPIQRLKTQVRSEVPVGSTREQLEAWSRRRLGCKPSYEDSYSVDYKGTTLAEAAGVPWGEIGSSALVVIRNTGWYTVNGQAVRNHMWVFFTLDETGRVKDHHFLTLEELAGIERRRDERQKN